MPRHPSQLNLFPGLALTRDEQKEKSHIVGYAANSSVYVNGKWLNPKPSQKIRSHSTTGFSWGYAGSGPSQLALAILLKLYDKRTALDFAQSFKFDVIAMLKKDKDFSLSIAEVDEHISRYKYVRA